MALRYDHTVPLARVVGTYGSRLPSPYKRYAIGPVWRADRPAHGRFREFTQCDIDTVGSASSLAVAEIVWAVHDGLEALGVSDFRFLVNSGRRCTAPGGLRCGARAGRRRAGQSGQARQAAPEAVCAELLDCGPQTATAEGLVADLASAEPDRVRERLAATERGRRRLVDVDRLVELTAGLPAIRVVFAPGMVRGLDYYTGPTFEVVGTGFPGSIASGGRYDGLVARLGGPDLPACGGSISVERILAVQAAGEQSRPGLDVAITVLGAEDEVMRLAGET